MHYSKPLNIVKSCTRSKVSCKKNVESVARSLRLKLQKIILSGVHGSYDATAGRY